MKVFCRYGQFECVGAQLTPKHWASELTLRHAFMQVVQLALSAWSNEDVCNATLKRGSPNL